MQRRRTILQAIDIRPRRATPGFALAILAGSALCLGLCADPEAHAAASRSTAPCGTENLIAGKLPSHQEEIHGNAALVTDGAIVPEGALWDGPAAVKLESRAGALIYDLGEPHQVSAFYLQADANDTYTISGSLDNTLGSYRVLAKAANVVDTGHGMRRRTIQIPPVTVRYLRLGEPEGDNCYSVSEFAAYCQAPSPFPPALRVLDAPMAVGPKPVDDHPAVEAVGHKPSLLGPFEKLLALALVLLVGSSLWQRGKRDGEQASEPAPATPKLKRFFPLLFLLFMTSGCAALIYEIVWFQMLQLVLGSSAVSIAVLLGTFMGGMCIGSLSLARFVSQRRHPLRVYALLEIGIGCCGVLMLLAMPLVEDVYTAVVGHGVPGLLLRGLFAALCLLPPTAMMGATLPAVARWVKTTPRGVSWLGYFYGGNTVGAVLGCVLAGFFLLRAYNTWTASLVAVALNAIVATGAFLLARLEPRVGARAESEEQPEAGQVIAAQARPATPAWAPRVYLAIALSGMSALGAEVIWTRLFSLLLGGTTYTFSIILAVFLIGIGLGSAIGSFLVRRTSDALRALGVVQLLLVVAIAWTAWNISSLTFWPVNPKIITGPWYQFQIDFVRSLWAILPAACLWGASFPLALAAVASEADDGGRIVGRIYAANTVGAIVGSLAMSLIIITHFGTQNGERILIALAALTALLTLVPLGAGPANKLRLGAREGIWLVAIVLFASIAARNVAPVPAVLIAHGRTSAVDAHAQEKYLYVGEGMNSSLAISRNDSGIVSYHNAGKVQASSQPQDMRLQRMLGHLTTLVPEHPRSVLVVACGAGVTAGAVSIDPRVEHETIAEIEPLVPQAASQYFGEHNFNVVRNPKVHLVLDDARHFLNTTKEKFDGITSDPFDPWVKGAANLYTKEFWELVRAHLNPGGVVTVFVQLYESGVAASKSEIVTFFEVFPHGTIWGNPVRGVGYDTVLLGQLEPTRINVDEVQRLLASPEMSQVARSLRQIGFDSAVDLLSSYGGRASELKPWLRDAEINRDDNLRLQFLAGFDLNLDQRDETYKGILAYRQYPADIFIASPATQTTLRTAILEKK